jgi:hypothetical protein
MKPRPKDNKRNGKTKDRRLEINFWKQIVQGEIPPLFLTSTQETRLCLEIFWHLVKSAVLSWEQNRGTICLSSCEIENKVIHILPLIYKYLKLLKSRTAYYTSLRKNSWLRRDYRLRRIFSEMETGNYIHERNKNGDVIDSALRRPGTFHLSNPMQSSVNPEGNLIEKEEYGILDRILNRLGSCGRKYDSVYRKIMEMLLDGIDVGEEHADILGAPRGQVVTLKHQARILASKIASEEDPRLADNINYRVNQMKRKRNEKTIIKRLICLFITCKNKKLEGFISLLIFNLMKNRSARVMFR